MNRVLHKRAVFWRGQVLLRFAALGALFVIPLARAQVYLQTDLVSDLPGRAAHTDARLVNPWGLVANATRQFWIADNRSSFATVYDSSGRPDSFFLRVRAPGGRNGRPTGVIYNGTGDFQLPTDVVGMRAPARFIFATEEGTVAGYAGPPDPSPLIALNNSASGARYTGLAIGSNGTANFLYAADFHNARVDAIDREYALTTVPGNFADPTIPAGFAPFGIQNIDGVIYVSYARQNAARDGVVPGPGNGLINKFDANGILLGRFAAGGSLNAPWGMARAPAAFGPFGGALLIGNFGDGRINAFDPATGSFLGPLTDGRGAPIVIAGLWGLTFGQGGNGGDPNTLYFVAGIPGADAIEDHGLFGSIAFVPAERQLVNISSRAFVGTGDNVAIGGFILRSDSATSAERSKRVLIRGLGPSLAVGGMPVPGRLADPFLELHDGNGGIIAANNDWRETNQTQIAATGLAPGDDRESALLATLATDNRYTAVLRGNGNGTGIGLLEIYDLEATGTTHLANLSSRCFVGSGNQVLIGGVIVRGDLAARIVVRGVGPSLTRQGVAGALPDPTLDFYDREGSRVAHNDNWMEEPDGTPNPNRAAELMATGLAPSDSTEPAILTTLPPGAYTVIVRGTNGETGVALVEAYRLSPAR